MAQIQWLLMLLLAVIVTQGTAANQNVTELRMKLRADANAQAATTDLSSRSASDVTECYEAVEAQYDNCYNLVAQVSDAVNSGDNFNQYSGVPGYYWDGCYGTYCNFGFGDYVPASYFGSVLLNILDECWTQSGAANNAYGAGYHAILVGSGEDSEKGLICMGANPDGTGLACDCST